MNRSNAGYGIIQFFDRETNGRVTLEAGNLR